jgi:hypothetical protein
VESGCASVGVGMHVSFLGREFGSRRDTVDPARASSAGGRRAPRGRRFVRLLP